MGSIYRYLKSFLNEELVEASSSEYNPTLEVSYSAGRMLLNSQNSNYSYGTLMDVFRSVFKELDLKHRAPSSALILGLGAGCILQLFEDFEISPQTIGVELDPEVIRLANKHFDLAEYDNLLVLEQDANVFVQKHQATFDLIIVDLFLDQSIPGFAQTPQFLQQLIKRLNPGGVLIYNRMTETTEGRQQTVHFEEMLSILVQDFSVFTTSVNKFFIYEA